MLEPHGCHAGEAGAEWASPCSCCTSRGSSLHVSPPRQLSGKMSGSSVLITHENDRAAVIGGVTCVAGPASTASTAAGVTALPWGSEEAGSVPVNTDLCPFSTLLRMPDGALAGLCSRCPQRCVHAGGDVGSSEGAHNCCAKGRLLWECGTIRRLAVQ